MRVLLALLLLTMGLVGCERTAAQDADAFQRLCELYGEAIERDEDNFKRLNTLSNKVENELPDIYDFFKYLSELPAEEAFSELKDRASEVQGHEWKCDAARKFYKQ